MSLKKILRNKGYINGRAICGSKRVYREENPNSVCVFDACIVTEKEGQAWFGDLDLTKDTEWLREAAFDNEGTLYVLTDSDAFNLRNNSIQEMIAKAVWDTTKDTPSK
jgi:hypothetical protein